MLVTDLIFDYNQNELFAKEVNWNCYYYNCYYRISSLFKYKNIFIVEGVIYYVTVWFFNEIKMKIQSNPFWDSKPESWSPTYNARYSSSFPAAASDPSPFWLVLKVCHMITFSITWYSLFYTSDLSVLKHSFLFTRGTSSVNNI
jgi:hypothetical protein